LSGVNGQIVGGAAATLGQFPWQAFVYIDERYLCGGSLILDSWVLTAAHCVQGFNKYIDQRVVFYSIFYILLKSKLSCRIGFNRSLCSLCWIQIFHFDNKVCS